MQYLAQLCKLTEHGEFRDNLEEALRDRLVVCGILSVPIQKRLRILAEKDLNLQKAMQIAHPKYGGINSQPNSVHPVDLYLQKYSLQPLVRLVTGVEVKDICKIIVTLERKNVTIRDTLLRYAGHLQDNQTRKIQPSLELGLSQLCF